MNRFLILLVLGLIMNDKSVAQSNLAQFSAGFSRHGSGDLNGISYFFDYTHYFKNKLSWVASFGGDIHDGVSPLLFEYPTGNQVDASFRYTLAGIQIGSGIKYSLIKKEKHEVFISVIGIFRYQSSSASDAINKLYPALTNLPFPVMLLENSSPQRTYSVGAAPRIGYNYTFDKKIAVGFSGGLQFDTNGDTILQLLLTLGRRF